MNVVTESDAVMCWLSVWTHNAGVVSSNPALVLSYVRLSAVNRCLLIFLSYCTSI